MDPTNVMKDDDNDDKIQKKIRKKKKKTKKRKRNRSASPSNNNHRDDNGGDALIDDTGSSVIATASDTVALSSSSTLLTSIFGTTQASSSSSSSSQASLSHDDEHDDDDDDDAHQRSSKLTASSSSNSLNLNSLFNQRTFQQPNTKFTKKSGSSNDATTSSSLSSAIFDKKKKNRKYTKPTSTSLSRTTKEEQILQLRRRRSQSTMLSTVLDFPSPAFGGGGGGQQTQLPMEEQIVEIADCIRQYGVSIVRNVIDTNFLQQILVPIVDRLQHRLCSALDHKHNIDWRIQPNQHNHQQQKQEGPSSSPSISSGMFRFREAASRCVGRMDVVLDNDSLGDHVETYRTTILQNETIRNLVASLFGGNIGVISSNGDDDDDDDTFKLVYAGLIFNWPGSATQPWHQDGQPLFPESRDSAKIQASIPPYALNVFIPIESRDGELHRGPTEFVPGSHLWSTTKELDQVNGLHDDNFIRNDNNDFDERMDTSTKAARTTTTTHKPQQPTVVAPILKQGDMLCYDYRVCHRGTSNLSHIENDSPRRILYLMYARPWFQDHVNFDYTTSSTSIWEE